MYEKAVFLFYNEKSETREHELRVLFNLFHFIYYILVLYSFEIMKKKTKSRNGLKPQQMKTKVIFGFL